MNTVFFGRTIKKMFEYIYTLHLEQHKKEKLFFIFFIENFLDIEIKKLKYTRINLSIWGCQYQNE